jgi:hypothetical protein
MYNTYIVKMCSFRALTLSLTHYYFMLHIFRSLSQTYIRLCISFLLSLSLNDTYVHSYIIFEYLPFLHSFSLSLVLSIFLSPAFILTPKNYIHFIRLKIISFLHFASSIILHARILCKSLWVKLKMSERVCLCGCECV